MSPVSLGVFGGSIDYESIADSVGFKTTLYQPTATPQVSSDVLTFDEPNPNRSLLLVPAAFASSDLPMSVEIDGIAAIECFEYGGIVSHRHNVEYGLSRKAVGTSHTATQSVWNQPKRAFVFEYPNMMICRETSAGYSSTGEVSVNAIIPEDGFGLAVVSSSGGDYTEITNADLIASIPNAYHIFKVRESGPVVVTGSQVSRGIVYAGFTPANNPDALFTDGFARSAMGPNWLNAPNGLNIHLNQLAGSGSGSTYNGAVLRDYFPPDQYAEGELVETSAIGTARRGQLNLRDTEGSVRTGYSFWCVTDTASYWRITRWVEGLEEVLLAGVSGVDVVPPNARCRFEIQGTTLRAFIDGIQIAELEDSTTAVGKPGCGAYRSSVKWDTFEAGAL